MKGRKIIKTTVMYWLAMVAVLALAAGLWATGAAASDGRGLKLCPSRTGRDGMWGFTRGVMRLLSG
ncbi:MAG: hypothetical protein HN366_19360 [Deltaproteobacteria bacterium]|jgi:hypothetical protein|nr:hypothetical protein [Deltaproteobacteria bacterium]